MNREHALAVLVRFFRIAIAKLKVLKIMRLVHRVHASAMTIQSFLKMVVVRRRHQQLLVANRLRRHEEVLARYLNTKSLATLSTFLPRQKKEEEVERLVRGLMLNHNMSFEKANVLARQTIPADKSSHNTVSRTRDGAYGAFCNSRVVRHEEETSDSDDDSIDEVLLASRKLGRIRPLM